MTNNNVYAAIRPTLVIFDDGSGGSSSSATSPVLGQSYSGYLSNRPVNIKEIDDLNCHLVE